MMRMIFCRTCSLFRLPLLYCRDARDTSPVHRSKYIANVEHYELKSTLHCAVLCSYGTILMVVNHDMMGTVLCYSLEVVKILDSLARKFFCLSLNGRLVYGKTPGGGIHGQIYKKIELCCQYLLPHFPVLFHFLFQFLFTNSCAC